MSRQAWKIILLWAAVIALCVIVARAKADQSPQEQGGALWHESDAVLSREQTQPMSTGAARTGITAPLSQHLVSPCATVIAAATASTGSQRTTLPATDLLERETHRRETDPFRRCARKALAGAYGELAPWQITGYSQALAHTPVAALCWVTTYHEDEGNMRGNQCRWWDAGCSERVAAANELPGFAFVWMPETGLRQVLDTGADSNDRRARGREGAAHWVDFWEAHKGSLFGDHNGGTRKVWAVRGRTKAHWKHRASPSHAWLNY